MRAMSIEQLKDAHREAPSAPIVNVLDEKYFEQAHIPGSINIPLNRDDFVEQVGLIVGDRDNPVIVYCASESCDASAKAARKLEEAGFTNVYDYEEGMAGWQEAGEPVGRGTKVVPEFHPQ